MAEPSYYRVSAIAAPYRAVRTVEVRPDLLVDMEDDRVVGVERVSGPVGLDDLADVLRMLRWADDTKGAT